ncbi:MAG: bifunctional phosphopantothenoylcysteine decarboxylase/phosphopantothenate synthase [Gemmataceae bacterium]|nr:bifunctional phosphopantothenoylcysteine decarboxylase/phosphopantothenate synthase [Gemmataceae bacterium]
MNILITAGNTLTPIDKVRCITNVFTGRTGAQIALEGHVRGHRVTLLTSHPGAIAEIKQPKRFRADRLSVQTYRTFDDLQGYMAERVRNGGLDVVIHSAAVSDYRCAGIYAPDARTHFRPDDRTWEGEPPTLADMAAAKVKSDVEVLWLRLVRTPKLVDQVRTEWGFDGILVKFKLEVGVSEERLLEIAEHSRCHSDANLMVANTLEGAATWAYLGPIDGQYHRVKRAELASRLLDAIEARARERGHG